MKLIQKLIQKIKEEIEEERRKTKEVQNKSLVKVKPILNTKKEAKNLDENPLEKTFQKIIWILLIVGISLGTIFIFVEYFPNLNIKELVFNSKEEDLIKKQQEELEIIKGRLNDLTKEPVEITNNINNVSQPKNADLSSIVKEWTPRIVKIWCTTDYNNFSLGTGVLTRMDFPNLNILDKPTVITNKHVITDSDNGFSYSSCSFDIPEVDSFIELNMSNVIISPSEDVAYFPSLHSTNPPPGAKTAMKVCNSSDVVVGDNIAILGYPSNGGTGRASTAITLTQGVISSFDGGYYVTDAKIDRGNSGGAAILVKDSCYLGIPTWVQSGGFESFGRILSADYFFD